MKANEFFKTIGKLSGNQEYSEFVAHLGRLIELLDEMDCNDAFGTEGWKHAIGLDD